MADEDDVVVEGEGGTTEEAPAGEAGAGLEGAEFVPEVTAKPKPNTYTALLILAFVAFLAGVILAGNELYDFYDVQFWVFSKK